MSEAYVYSSEHGAPLEVTRTIGTSSYTFDYAYDGAGRLSQVTYPTNVHGTRLAVEYTFDVWGALDEVRDAATSAVYFSLEGEDALGRTRQATLGNGLVEARGYDATTGRLATGEALSAPCSTCAWRSGRKRP